MTTDPTPTDRRRARSAASRARILDAAESLVRTGGIKALTTKALVEKAGVSERTVFNHFDNLDQILITRITEYIEPLFAPSQLTEHSRTYTNVSVRQIPELIEAEFLKALETEQVQHALGKFHGLALAVAEQNHELLGKHLVEILSRASLAGFARFEKNFPTLTTDQRYAIALYLHNLTFSLAIGFGRGTEILIAGGADPNSLTAADLLPHFRWAITQINRGKPQL